MKHLSCILLLTIVIGLSATEELSAQSSEPEWIVVVDRFNLINLYGQGASLMSQGYAPVALDFSADGLAHIVFLKDVPFEVEAWRIEVFDETDDVNTEIESLVDQGWLPVDISFHREQMAVLLIRTDATLLDWGIGQGERSVQNIQSVMRDAADRGMALFGVTAHGEHLWYLFLEFANPPLRQAEVVGTSTDSFYETVNRRVDQGYGPWSLLFEADRVYVVFLR